MTQRVIVVGDVHGCFDELSELLDKCHVTSADRVISLGDIVDRGKKTRECVDFFMGLDKPDARSMVLGNHEQNLMKYYEKWCTQTMSGARSRGPDSYQAFGQSTSWRTEYHKKSFLALEPKHFEWFKTLPKFLRLPEYTVPNDLPIVLIHAGCVPQAPLEHQGDHILMHVSNLPPPTVGYELDGVKHGYWTGHEDTKWTSKAPVDWPFWAKTYDGSLGHVVFGHSGFDEPALFPFATGIDLGCPFGRKLCALILPDWKFVTVDARESYVRNSRIHTFEVFPGIFVHS